MKHFNVFTHPIVYPLINDYIDFYVYENFLG